METQGYIIPGSHEKEAIDLFYISVNDGHTWTSDLHNKSLLLQIRIHLKHSSKTASFSKK